MTARSCGFVLALLMLTLVSTSATWGDEKTITVDLEIVGPHPATPIAARLSLHPLGRDAIDRSLAVEVPGEVQVDLTADIVWELELEAEKYWAKPTIVTPRAAKAIALRLLPTGRVISRLVIDDAASPPATVDVQFSSQSEQRSCRLTCRVDSQKSLDCRLPTGLLDLKIQAPGFVPRYFWQVEVRSDEPTRLDKLTLVSGASLAGWIELDGEPHSHADLPDHEDLPRAAAVLPTVELSPAVAASPDQIFFADDPLERQLELRTVTTTVNRKGFFQLTDLAPGTYTLTARQPGFADTRVSPLTVLETTETLLSQPLTLRPPAELTVIVAPPLAPDGEPWQLMLFDRDQNRHRDGERGRRGRADLNGWWTVPELEPGSYLLIVEATDPRGSDPARWASREIEVSAAEPAIEIEIPIVPLRGRVFVGDEPLATTVWFGGRDAAVRQRFVSDDDGLFEGYLPRAGTWEIELSTSGDKRTVQKLDPVDIDQPSGDEPATVEIRVPAASLAGQVVDEAGDAVAAAVVLLVSAEKKSREAQVVSDAQGHFAIHGVRSGTAFLVAEAGEQASDWQRIDIADDREQNDLRLVVKQRRELHGRVVSASGVVPGTVVPGASLVVLPETHGVPADVAQAVTGGDGRFELALPAATSEIEVLVFPPGHSLRLFRAHLADGVERPLEISVTAAGGTLVIDADEDPSAAVVFHQGAAISLRLLRRWLGHLDRSAVPSDHRLVLPQVESGHYKVCSVGNNAEAFAAHGDLARCASGHLAAHGELVLELPSAPSAVASAIEPPSEDRR